MNFFSDFFYMGRYSYRTEAYKICFDFRGKCDIKRLPFDDAHTRMWQAALGLNALVIGFTTTTSTTTNTPTPPTDVAEAHIYGAKITPHCCHQELGITRFILLS